MECFQGPRKEYAKGRGEMIDKIHCALLILTVQAIAGCMHLADGRAISNDVRLERVQLIRITPRIDLYIRTGEAIQDSICLYRARELISLSTAETVVVGIDNSALAHENDGDACNEDDDDEEYMLSRTSCSEYLACQYGEGVWLIGVAPEDGVVYVVRPEEVRELEFGYLVCLGFYNYRKYYRDSVLSRIFDKVNINHKTADEN